MRQKETRFENLCSAPEELWEFFQRTYCSKTQNTHRSHINAISEALYQQFHSMTLNAENLFELLITALIEYQQHTIADKKTIRESIITENSAAQKGMMRCTVFRLDDGVGESPRKFSNFLATKRIYEVGEASITVGELCDHAKKFFGFSLGEFSDEERERLIAKIELSDEGQYEHWFCPLLSDRDQTDSTLNKLYNALLNIIQSTGRANLSEKLNAVFLLVFLIGSNPPLYCDRGGAFLTDFMLLYLTRLIGLTPVRKNFLNITEIELLLCFFEPQKSSWEKPAKLYFEALTGKTNLLFHPISAGPKGLLVFLSQPRFTSLYECTDKFLLITPKKNDTYDQACSDAYQDVLEKICCVIASFKPNSAVVQSGLFPSKKHKPQTDTCEPRQTLIKKTH